MVVVLAPSGRRHLGAAEHRIQRNWLNPENCLFGAFASSTQSDVDPMTSRSPFMVRDLIFSIADLPPAASFNEFVSMESTVGVLSAACAAKTRTRESGNENNPTLGVVADGFDATVAWSKNQSGVRVKEGEELSKTKRDADFHRYLNLKKLYPDLHYKGTDKVDGEEVHVLESKPSASPMGRFSFSTKSNLLIRQESEFEGPQGKVGLTVRLTEFLPVDEINYAHSLKLKLRAGEQEFEFAIRVKEVKHNGQIEDAKFAKPAS